MPAQPWKSGPLGPRKRVRIFGALAPVVAFLKGSPHSFRTGRGAKAPLFHAFDTLNIMHYIYGINSVTEALKAQKRSFEWVGMAKERHDIRLQRLIEDCRRLGVTVRFLERTELDRWRATRRIRAWSRLRRPSSTTIWTM